MKENNLIKDEAIITKDQKLLHWPTIQSNGKQVFLDCPSYGSK